MRGIVMSDDSLTRLWVQWLGKLGNYDLGSEDIINQLLGEKEGGARKKLYEGMESITESCMARLKFYNFIINKYPDTSNQKNFKAQSIKMAELLEGDLNGESGLELYKAACAEENNTQAFRNAVFMASTKT